jgi:hypothetical protein
MNVGGGVIVVRKDIPEKLHFLFIGFRFKDIKSTQIFSCLGSEPDKHPIADKEKVIAQNFWKSPGPQRFCLHHGHCDERPFVVESVQIQTLRDQMLKLLFGNGKRKNERAFEKSVDGKGVIFQE